MVFVCACCLPVRGQGLAVDPGDLLHCRPGAGIRSTRHAWLIVGLCFVSVHEIVRRKPVVAWLRAGAHSAPTPTHQPDNKRIGAEPAPSGRVKIRVRLGLLLMPTLFLSWAVVALRELKFLGWGRGSHTCSEDSARLTDPSELGNCGKPKVAEPESNYLHLLNSHSLPTSASDLCLLGNPS